MQGLIIKPQWADMILSGAKTWEIRGSRTTKRGRIGIIKSGSGMVYGEVELEDCLPLTYEAWHNNMPKHQVPYQNINYKTPYAWVLTNARLYDEPIPYKHPQGAVIWVNLGEEKHS
ncbi:ASCH domain-containing protein [Paenibacillus sp. FSL K6-1230]|uniref:ASCH domain-containing protein n=1 Tax=Paenibacillus sp. FSL K6-1230 TaxID=2921603 RepID=UPI0030F4EF1C